MSQEVYDVICLGAGFAGLSAAHYLLKEKPDLKLCILEAKDRVGGRTFMQTLKCVDKEGKDDEYPWDMGGMWVGSCQKDVMELLEELGAETYKQYTEGMKCVQLSQDDQVKTYTTDLPSVGLLGAIDLGQTMYRMESLIGSIDPQNPFKHPDAELLDSMTVASFLKRYYFTTGVKDMTQIGLRVVFGADSSQINALYFLTTCASAGSLQEVVEATPGSAQEFKIKGGAQAICIKLAEEKVGMDKVKLSSPVKSIEQTDDMVTIATEDGRVYKAKHVISTIQPHQLLRVNFSPPLPYAKTKLCQHMPVGHLIKFIITYKEAYWRTKGYSGQIVTTAPRPGEEVDGPLGVVYDATSEYGHPALVGLIGGDQAMTWGDKLADERRMAVLSTLAAFFDCKDLLSPVDYAEKDWAKEPYNGGCPAGIVTSGAMKYYAAGLRETFGRIEFAGTETSEVWCAFISGAVHSAKVASSKVLTKLNNIN